MIRFVHPGSRIRMLTFYPSRIPDPGVKKAPDPGSRIRIRNTAKKVTLRYTCCLGTGILVSWPPVTQVGSLKRCLAPVVVVASGWIRNQVPFRRVPPVPSYRFFWRSWQSWHFLSHLVPYCIPVFNHSVRKKCLQISSLVDSCLRFSLGFSDILCQRHCQSRNSPGLDPSVLSDTVESKGRHMKQCWIVYRKRN
jgi:hypothetical protein